MLPRDINPGDPILARWLNQVKNEVLQSIRGDGLITVARSNQNVTISFGGNIPGVRGAWAEVTEIGFDALTCRLLKLEEGESVAYGDTILVNKPDELLHDADQYPNVVNLETVNQQEVDVDDDTGGGATNEETWVVTPRYVVGKLIMVEKRKGRNGWWDTNIAGRAWAVKAS